MARWLVWQGAAFLRLQRWGSRGISELHSGAPAAWLLKPWLSVWQFGEPGQLFDTRSSPGGLGSSPGTSSLDSSPCGRTSKEPFLGLAPGCWAQGPGFSAQCPKLLYNCQSRGRTAEDAAVKGSESPTSCNPRSEPAPAVLVGAAGHPLIQRPRPDFEACTASITLEGALYRCSCLSAAMALCSQTQKRWEASLERHL